MSKRLTEKEKAEVVADFIAGINKSDIAKKFKIKKHLWMDCPPNVAISGWLPSSNLIGSRDRLSAVHKCF